MLRTFLLLLLLTTPLRVLGEDSVYVFDIIDGDTLSVRYQSVKQNLRLIGVDAPEMRENPKALKDAGRSGSDLETIFRQGRESRSQLKSLISRDSTLKVEFDIEKKDKYGRLLGYIYLPDGRMVNDEMLKLGYARLMTVPPNVRYVDRFKKNFSEARDKGMGLWAGEK